MAMSLIYPAYDNDYSQSAPGYVYVQWDSYDFPVGCSWWAVGIRIYAGTDLVYHRISGHITAPLYLNPGIAVGPLSATRSATFHIYADVYCGNTLVTTEDLGIVNGITETTLQPYSTIKLRQTSGWTEGAGELPLNDPSMANQDITLTQLYSVSLYADLAFQEFRDNPWIEHLAFDLINDAPTYGDCLPSEYRYSINGGTPTAWEIIHWYYTGYMYPQQMSRFVIGKFIPKHWNTVRIDTRNVSGTFTGPTFKVLTAPTLVNTNYVEDVGLYPGNTQFVETVPGVSETVIHSSFAENKVIVIKDNSDTYGRKKANWR